MKKQILFLLCSHILALIIGTVAFFSITAWEHRDEIAKAPKIVKVPKKIELRKTAKVPAKTPKKVEPPKIAKAPTKIPQKVEPPKIVEPPKRSRVITFSNGYETSSQYLMYPETSSKYCEILNSCPIPLKLRTYKEYEKQYLSKVVKKYEKYETTSDFAGKNTAGQHVSGYPVEDWPNYFLFVKTGDNPHSVIGTYFHEMGHYDCNTGKCPHCKAHGHKHISELHAIMNELEEAMRYDFPEVIEASFGKYKWWTGEWDNYKKYQEYGDAVLTIQASGLWTEVKSYAKKHNIDVPTFTKPKEVVEEKKKQRHKH